MAINPGTVKGFMKATKDAISIGKTVTNRLGGTRQSITKIASNAIFEFPHVISGAIETDEAMTLLKASEFALSNFVIASLGRVNSVNIDVYKNVDNYLAEFHNNSDINPNFLNSFESVTNIEFANGMFSKNELTQLALECLNNADPRNALDLESLNDVYKPYNATKYKMEESIRTIENGLPATEASGGGNPNKSSIADQWQEADKKREGYSMNKGKLNYDYATKVDKNGKTVQDGYKKGNLSKFGSYRNATGGVKGYLQTDKRSLSTMEPTMINVELTMFSDKSGHWSQNVIIGIKALPRIILSNIMVSNMLDAVIGSNGAFALIKLAEKEIKTALFMFGPLKALKDAKDSALSKNDINRFMNMAKRRKMFNSAQSIQNAKVPPNLNVIMTSAEAEQVRQLTGIDLLNPGHAKKILEKYFILSFGIYDTESKEYRVMYDTDNDWNFHTLYSLQNAINNGRTYMETHKKVMEPMRA